MSSDQQVPKDQTNDINFNENKALSDGKSSERKSSSDRRLSFFRRRSRSKSIDEGGIKSISDIVGNWGPYQTRVFVMYIAVYVVASMENNSIIFYTQKVDHWCKLPDGVNKVNLE